MYANCIPLTDCMAVQADFYFMFDIILLVATLVFLTVIGRYKNIVTIFC